MLSTRMQLAIGTISSRPRLSVIQHLCDRVAVLADRRVVANAPLAEVERLDHPWVQEYFHGPRARAAQTARDIHLSRAQPQA